MKRLLFFLAFFSYSITNAQSTNYKESAGMAISVPIINEGHFLNYRSNKNEHQIGYFGIGASLFYKNGRNEFSIGFESPLLQKNLFPRKGGYTGINCNLFEALIHHKMGTQFAIVGGLNYAVYQFHSYVDMPDYSDIDKTDATIGLTGGAEFIATKTTSFLLIYRPALFSFDNKNYWHTISLDCRFNINFWKGKGDYSKND